MNWKRIRNVTFFNLIFLLFIFAVIDYAIWTLCARREMFCSNIFFRFRIINDDGFFCVHRIRSNLETFDKFVDCSVVLERRVGIFIEHDFAVTFLFCFYYIKPCKLKKKNLHEIILDCYCKTEFVTINVIFQRGCCSF